jgi:hypothetical protein
MAFALPLFFHLRDAQGGDENGNDLGFGKVGKQQSI